MKLTSPLPDSFIVFIASLVIVQADPSNLAQRNAEDSPLDNVAQKRELTPGGPSPFFDNRIHTKRRIWDNETWNSFISELRETFDDIEEIVDSGVSKIKQGWEKFKELYLEREEKNIESESPPPTNVVFRRASARRGVLSETWEAMKSGFKQGVEDAKTYGKDAANRAKEGWEQFKSIFVKRDLDLGDLSLK